MFRAVVALSLFGVLIGNGCTRSPQTPGESAMWPLSPEKRTEVLLQYMASVRDDIRMSVHYRPEQRKTEPFSDFEKEDMKRWEDWDSRCEADLKQIDLIAEEVFEHSNYVTPRLEEIRHKEIGHAGLWDRAFAVEQRHLKRLDDLRPKRTDRSNAKSTQPKTSTRDVSSAAPSGSKSTAGSK